MDTLLEAVSSGFISHAYIIIGSLQKILLKAENLAMAINCKIPEVPCGNCSSCRKISQKIHPDVFEIAPKGSSIGINQIREMVLNFPKKPVEGTRKIYIIKEAHRMTVEAQNALLKTLEEPTGQSIIILLVDNIKKLLPTVISRCQIYDYTFEEEIEISTETKEKLAKILLSAIKDDISSLGPKAQELIDIDEKTENLLEFCLSYFRDILILKTRGKAFLYNKDIEELIEKGENMLFLDSLLLILKKTLNQLKIAKSRGNKNLIWFNLLLELREVMHSGYYSRCTI